MKRTTASCSLQLEGLLYLNTWSQQADTTTAAGTATAKTTGMSVDRAYLTTKYFINSDWMLRVTLDAGNDPSLAGKTYISHV